MSIADQINWTQPINWKHPSMKGLISRWRAVPKRAGWGSGTWRDLVQRSQNHGTLTNGPTWDGARGRQGGFGSINTDGSNDFVAMPTTATMGTGFAFSVWVRPTGIADFHSIVGISKSSGFRYLAIESSQWRFLYRDLAGLEVHDVQGSTTGLANGSWIHVVANHDNVGAGGYSGLWVKGVRATTATGTSSDDWSIPSEFSFGRLSAGAGRYFLGQVDDFMLYGRGLSGAEIAQLYDATSRRDDPTLNWIRPTTYFAPTAAASDAVPQVWGQYRRRRAG